MSNDVIAFFNGAPTLEIVQGEDVSLIVTLRGTQTQLPFDLTGTDFTIAFVSVDDRNIYRSTLPIQIAASAAAIGANVIDAPNHGLVSGDTVQVSGSALPAPLVAQAYYVSVQDQDTISLLDPVTNLPIVFTAPGSSWSLSASGVVVSPPLTSGNVSVTLTSTFTSNIKSGIGQTFQIETIRSGLVHIYLETNEVDVYEQI